MKSPTVGPIHTFFKNWFLIIQKQLYSHYIQTHPPWGILILDDIRPMGYKLSCIVFGLGKSLLFKSNLGRCAYELWMYLSVFFLNWEMDWFLRDFFISTNNVWHSPLKYKVLDELVGENNDFSFFFQRHFYCNIRRKKTKNATYERNLTYLKFVQCQG